MQDVVIVAARRTAIGTFGGSLATLPATELGSRVIKDILANTGVSPEQVDEVLRPHASVMASCAMSATPSVDRMPAETGPFF